MSITTRFKDIVEGLDNYYFHILGCGAIGSSTAIQLARMGAEKFCLYDMDRVSLENIGVSHYILNDINKPKVNALKDHILSINSSATVKSFDGLFEIFEYQGDNDVAILGFDSMQSRLDAVKVLCENPRIKPLFIVDGRMGAEQYQQYFFAKPTVKSYEKKWYPDSEGDPEPCTSKATSYCSNMSGSFIVNTVKKFITGERVQKEIVFSFPAMLMKNK